MILPSWDGSLILGSISRLGHSILAGRPHSTSACVGPFVRGFSPQPHPTSHCIELGHQIQPLELQVRVIPQGLLDRPVPDDVYAHLQAGQMGVVEELHQLLLGEVPGPVPLGVDIGVEQQRRSGADGAVEGEVAPDTRKAEVHDEGVVLVFVGVQPVFATFGVDLHPQLQEVSLGDGQVGPPGRQERRLE